MQSHAGQLNALEDKPQPVTEAKSKPAAQDDLKSLSLPEVEKKLGSSPDGLTQAEAQRRLAQYGPNEIEEKKTNEILKFLSYFWGPIPWMIEAAVILSAAARHWPDFAIILLLLLANAVVGFWEEHQAGNAIAALKARLAIKARVKRDGKWINPAARELVPGASSPDGAGGCARGLQDAMISFHLRIAVYAICDSPFHTRTASHQHSFSLSQTRARRSHTRLAAAPGRRETGAHQL